MMSIISVILGVTCFTICVLVDKAVEDANKTIQDIAIKNLVTYKKR